MTRNWAEMRAQMPVCRNYAYFDHAAVAPLPLPAAKAIELWLRESQESGDAHWPEWAARVETARKTVAAGLNAQPSEIAFVGSTTEGITLAAEGLDWRSGDQVVVFDDEFPSNVYPWMNLESRGVEVIRTTAGEQPAPQDLLAACTSRTRLISISWVAFAQGWRFDIEELVNTAHRRGILVFLDAIQGMGVFPLDVETTPVDFLAADGHKWMLGPEGAGVFYVRNEHLRHLRPLNVGWNSMRHAYDFQRIEWDLRPEARRYEGGSQNMAGIHALGASVAMLQEFGWGANSARLANRVLDISTLAAERLRAAGATIHSQRDDRGRASGIVAFEFPNRDSQSLRDQAFRENVILSCRNGRLRIAAHAYNDEQDIDRLVAAFMQ